MFIEKLVRVDVDEEAYIEQQGKDPYGDGRPIEEAIEVDVEQAILECLPDAMGMDLDSCQVEVGS